MNDKLKENLLLCYAILGDYLKIKLKDYIYIYRMGGVFIHPERYRRLGEFMERCTEALLAIAGNLSLTLD